MGGGGEWGGGGERVMGGGEEERRCWGCDGGCWERVREEGEGGRMREEEGGQGLGRGSGWHGGGVRIMFSRCVD